MFVVLKVFQFGKATKHSRSVTVLTPFHSSFHYNTLNSRNKTTNFVGVFVAVDIHINKYHL
jgi:hypothetical protein